MSMQKANGPTVPAASAGPIPSQAKPYEAPTLAVLGILEVVAGGGSTPRSDGAGKFQ